MTQPDADEVRRLARMVAGRELDAAMNVAELDERFPAPSRPTAATWAPQQPTTPPPCGTTRSNT
ncbi:hypothetical protein [Streptomyces sp. NPDC091649]|uniref:hypothetical protein n=1 Tax=Streptomyces sp. NPDC091649 TaxID=3366004 RepID=UPI0037F293BE